jgi:8-oxo-dGTP pyrophosphatase MutT (NUDIX family)
MKCICGKCKFLITTYICNNNIYYNNNIIRKKAGVIIHNPTLNKILIIQSRGNLWGFPKGSFNQGESFENCALRELKEETGITLHNSIIENSEYHNVNDNVRYYFVKSDIDYEDVNLQYDKYCNNNDVNGICWINLECLKELYLNNRIKLNYHARNCLYKFFNITKKF